MKRKGGNNVKNHRNSTGSRDDVGGNHRIGILRSVSEHGGVAMVGTKEKHALTNQKRTLNFTQEECTTFLKKVKIESQNYRIMCHLFNHGSITQKEAARLYDVWRLPSRIHELREHGAIIKTVSIPTKSKCASSSYARYELEGIR